MTFRKLGFKSLQSQITVIFLTLILVVQFIGFSAIRYSISKNARASIQEQLEVGEQVFLSFLDHNGESLTQGAKILATDYGFRQAIASEDLETIESALDNHRLRISASAALLYSPDGIRKAIAGKIPYEMADKAIVSLIASAQLGGNAYSIGIFNNVPYQLVAVPVKAPLTVAWVVMAFVIDDKLARSIENVTHLEVTFAIKNKSGAWVSSASTMNEQAFKIVSSYIPKRLSPQSINSEVLIDGSDYGTRYVQVLDNHDQVLFAILQRSISKALAPYNALQFNLLILTLLGALVFVAGSIFTSRRLTQPLTDLVKTAGLLEKGDYSVAITTNREDEIGNLGRSFDRMREAIRIREQNITKLAYWDKLTELPNRLYFIEKLSEIANSSQSTNRTFSVIVMNLDRFKNINDVLGHSAGDVLLAGFAKRIQANCKNEKDIVARLGGDEFGIILPDTSSKMAFDVCFRLQDALIAPIALKEHSVDISAGIGIANYPEHSKDAEVLLSQAEMAMDTAKSMHIDICVYHNELDVTNEENLSLISEIRTAVEHNQLRLYVQPKIDLSTGQILSVEALVRWHHPERGLIYPDMFIPFAEQTGHVSKISWWMLSEASRNAALWRDLGLDIAVAVNLSARDLMDIELPIRLQAVLNEHKILAKSITVEITESSIMDDPVRAQNTVERIASMGIELSIDDFGTGYSSLAYLKRLPVNELKIDKSFVMNIENDADDIAIVRSTIELGHTMGLKVVAEGIENVRVWNILKDMGCDYGQGYFMCRPIPADELLTWIKKWKTTDFALTSNV